MQQCFLFFCYCVTLNPLKRHVEINEIFLDIEMQNAIIGPMLVHNYIIVSYHCVFLLWQLLLPGLSGTHRNSLLNVKVSD